MFRVFAQMSLAFLTALGLTQTFGDSPPAPKPLTIDEAVRLSSFVAVGETVRVAFTRNGSELKNDPQNPIDHGVFLEVKIKKILLNKDKELPEIVRINFPGGVDGSMLRSKYQNKDFIYFVQVVRTKRNAGGTVVVDEHLRFTRGRRIVYPYSIEHLDQIVQSVEARAKGELAK